MDKGTSFAGVSRFRCAGIGGDLRTTICNTGPPTVLVQRGAYLFCASSVVACDAPDGR